MKAQRIVAMLEINLDPKLARHLSDISARVGQAPEELARRALLAYLEDLEDYALAVEASKEFDPDDTVSLDELMARYDVEG
jgi:predicted DNA-binding protein